MAKGLQDRLTVDSVFMQLPVLNMLNTRYIIFDLNQPPVRNPKSLGNAWFVSGIKVVETADEELAAINGINPSETAVLHKQFVDHVQGKTFTKGLNGDIKLTEYQPNYLKYEVKTGSEQLAVFSDIYYENGWNAFIDGKPVPHFRVNYILRALVIPADASMVEFRFEPKAYYNGNKVSLASSFLLILAIAGYFVNEIRKRKRNTGDN